MSAKSKELRKMLDNIDDDIDCYKVLQDWSDCNGLEVAMQDFKYKVRELQENTREKEVDLFSGPMFEIPKPEVKRDKMVSTIALKRDTCFNCGLKLHGFIGYIDSEGEIYCENCLKGGAASDKA